MSNEIEKNFSDGFLSKMLLILYILVLVVISSNCEKEKISNYHRLVTQSKYSRKMTYGSPLHKNFVLEPYCETTEDYFPSSKEEEMKILFLTVKLMQIIIKV